MKLHAIWINKLTRNIERLITLVFGGCNSKFAYPLSMMSSKHSALREGAAAIEQALLIQTNHHLFWRAISYLGHITEQAGNINRPREDEPVTNFHFLKVQRKPRDFLGWPPISGILSHDLLTWKGNSTNVRNLACVQTSPLPQKKIGRRDVCESPTQIVFRYTFA